MSLESLKRALVDKSISDEKFSELLLKYFADQEAEDGKSGEGIICSIDSPYVQKMEAEMSQLRAQVENMRPAVMGILIKHVVKKHKDCCCGLKNNTFPKGDK